MSQPKSESSIDQKSMGSIKNNPFLTGNVKKSFRKQSSEKQAGGKKISSILNKWKQQETKIEQNYTKKPNPPPKKDIYTSNPEHNSEEWLNPQLKPDYKPNKDGTVERVIKTEIIPVTQPDTNISKPKPSDPLKEKQEEIRLIKSKLSNTKQKTDALSAENNTLKMKIESLKENNSQLKDKNIKLNTRINKLQTSYENIENEHNEMKMDSNNTQNEEIITLKKKLASLREELESSKEINSDNKEREKLINVLQKRIEGQEKEINEINAEKDINILQLEKENKVKVEEIGTYKQQIERLKNELKNSRDKTMNLSQSLMDTVAATNDDSVIKELKRKIAELRQDKDSKISELNDIIEDKEKDLKDHEKYINQLKKRNQHLNGKNEKLMMENGELMEQNEKMNDLMVKLKELQKENKELKKSGNGNFNNELEDVGDEYVDINVDLPQDELQHDDVVDNVPDVIEQKSSEVVNEEFVDNDNGEQYVDIGDGNEDNGNGNDNDNDNAPEVNDEFVDVHNEQTVSP
eukprot:274861_1